MRFTKFLSVFVVLTMFSSSVFASLADKTEPGWVSGADTAHAFRLTYEYHPDSVAKYIVTIFGNGDYQSQLWEKPDPRKGGQETHKKTTTGNIFTPGDKGAEGIKAVLDLAYQDFNFPGKVPDAEDIKKAEKDAEFLVSRIPMSKVDRKKHGMDNLPVVVGQAKKRLVEFGPIQQRRFKEQKEAIAKNEREAKERLANTGKPNVGNPSTQTGVTLPPNAKVPQAKNGAQLPLLPSTIVPKVDQVNTKAQLPSKAQSPLAGVPSVPGVNPKGLPNPLNLPGVNPNGIPNPANLPGVNPASSPVAGLPNTQPSQSIGGNLPSGQNPFVPNNTGTQGGFAGMESPRSQIGPIVPDGNNQGIGAGSSSPVANQAPQQTGVQPSQGTAPQPSTPATQPTTATRPDTSVATGGPVGVNQPDKGEPFASTGVVSHTDDGGFDMHVYTNDNLGNPSYVGSVHFTPNGDGTFSGPGGATASGPAGSRPQDGAVAVLSGGQGNVAADGNGNSDQASNSSGSSNDSGSSNTNSSSNNSSDDSDDDDTTASNDNPPPQETTDTEEAGYCPPEIDSCGSGGERIFISKSDFDETCQDNTPAPDGTGSCGSIGGGLLQTTVYFMTVPNPCDDQSNPGQRDCGAPVTVFSASPNLFCDHLGQSGAPCPMMRNPEEVYSIYESLPTFNPYAQTGGNLLNSNTWFNSAQGNKLQNSIKDAGVKAMLPAQTKINSSISNTLKQTNTPQMKVAPVQNNSTGTKICAGGKC